jgi:pyruvate formate lyase activating enzyme
MIWLRIVVLPGGTDSSAASIRLATTAGWLPFTAVFPDRWNVIDLLPYHNWCQDKYRWLGRPWSFAETESVDPGEIEPLLELYLAAGLNATIGGSGFEAQATASGCYPPAMAIAEHIVEGEEKEV